MKAPVFRRYGRADQIAFADIPWPTLKPDEILVHVRARLFHLEPRRAAHASQRRSSGGMESAEQAA